MHILISTYIMIDQIFIEGLLQVVFCAILFIFKSDHWYQNNDSGIL